VPADDFDAAATRAAATWSDPMLGSSIDITVEPSSDPHVDTAYDMQSTISFKTDSWEDGVNYFREQLALTTLWNRAGRIVDADTEINGYDPAYQWAVLPDDPTAAASSPDVDLVAALTHELGHVVGLDHPCLLGDPVPGEKTNTGAPVPDCSDPSLPASVRDATMFPSASPGSITERTLSSDEKLALHDLYSDKSGCAIAGRPSPTPTWAWAGALGVAALFARRRRARTRP
jgi:MYXO-CTERM domain-containing protein